MPLRLSFSPLLEERSSASAYRIGCCQPTHLDLRMFHGVAQRPPLQWSGVGENPQIKKCPAHMTNEFALRFMHCRKLTDLYLSSFVRISEHVMIIYVEAYLPNSRKSMSERHGVLFSSSVLTYLGIGPFKHTVISNKSQKPMYSQRKWEPLVPPC
jgi:hypothetical protein